MPTYSGAETHLDDAAVRRYWEKNPRLDTFGVEIGLAEKTANTDQCKPEYLTIR
jgi:hypothetical protein